MKEEHSPENPPLESPSKSFSVAIAQMAQLLRSQVKLKERSMQILSTSSLSISFQNSLKQIAKMLRKEIHSSKTPKKRSWKRQSSKRKKR